MLDDIKSKVLKDMDELCSTNAYHNREHIETVLKNLDRVQEHLLEKLSVEDELLLRIAILYHDYAHSGYELRSECPKEIPRKDLSNEEYSALICSEDLEDLLSKEQIMVIQRIILTTTVGNRFPAQNKLEKLMAFVDIANFMNGEDLLKEDSLKLSQEHGSKDILSQTSRSKFIEHIKEKLNNIRQFINDEFYQTQLDKLDSLLAT